MSVIDLDKIGALIVSGIQENLDSKGLTNTGQTKRSLHYNVTATTLTVFGAASLFSLEGGAAPLRNKTGGFVEAIERWAVSKLGKNRKQARSLAFAYMKKRVGDGIGGRTTARDGRYVVPNPFNIGGVLSDTVNKSLVDRIKKTASDMFFVNTKAEVKSIIKGF